MIAAVASSVSSVYQFLKSQKKEKSSDFIVTEGVGGYFFYHISRRETHYKSLCGRQTMRTGFPLKDFPIKLADHIPHGNCRRCKELMDNESK